MRLFIAINFPAGIKRNIRNNIQDLILAYPKISWTKTENIHLTLKFLGSVDEKKISVISDAIKNITETEETFFLDFTGFGFFDRNDLIVWVGIKNSSELQNVVARIETSMEIIGFAGEKRNYSPHVTLGRARNLSEEERLKFKLSLKKHSQTVKSSYKVSEIILMQSTLSPHGSIYNPVEKFTLR